MTDAHLISGNNYVSSDPSAVATALNLFNGVSDLDNTNLSLIAMSATANISPYWERAFYMNSISSYGFKSISVKFSVSSPMATTTQIKIKMVQQKITTNKIQSTKF